MTESTSSTAPHAHDQHAKVKHPLKIWLEYTLPGFTEPAIHELSTNKEHAVRHSLTIPYKTSDYKVKLRLVVETVNYRLKTGDAVPYVNSGERSWGPDTSEQLYRELAAISGNSLDVPFKWYTIEGKPEFINENLKDKHPVAIKVTQSDGNIHLSFYHLEKHQKIKKSKAAKKQKKQQQQQQTRTQTAPAPAPVQYVYAPPPGVVGYPAPAPAPAPPAQYVVSYAGQGSPQNHLTKGEHREVEKIIGKAINKYIEKKSAATGEQFY